MQNQSLKDENLHLELYEDGAGETILPCGLELAAAFALSSWGMIAGSYPFCTKCPVTQNLRGLSSAWRGRCHLYSLQIWKLATDRSSSLKLSIVWWAQTALCAARAILLSVRVKGSENVSVSSYLVDYKSLDHIQPTALDGQKMILADY